MQISVMGAGAWGTALAAHAAKRYPTLLWLRDHAQLEELSRLYCNQRYLPDIALPQALMFTDDLSQALQHVDCEDGLLLLAVPVSGLRDLLRRILAHGKVPRHIVCVCKGIEADTHFLVHQIVESELGQGLSIAILSGPSFAAEVARGLPVALTVASHSSSCTRFVTKAFHHHAMRIYSSSDLIGVEVGGAVKNVLAIATGISDGLALGLNARAALITRGLAEMSRLGVALGGQAETFMGLSGLGDLILTATGSLSRNRSVGLQLAQGHHLNDILEKLGHVAEGVYCAQAVADLAKTMKIDMPITRLVSAVLFEGYSLNQGVNELLQRDAKQEY